MNFIKMSDEEFKIFQKRSMESYGKDIARNREISEEEGIKLAHEQEEDILKPKEGETHYFFTLIENEKKCGWLWVNSKEVGARKDFFIYDIFLEEEFRGRGLGEKAMSMLEDKVKELKGSRIGLHVFGFNERAIKLYKKMGYETTNIGMRKKL